MEYLKRFYLLRNVCAKKGAPKYSQLRNKNYKCMPTSASPFIILLALYRKMYLHSYPNRNVGCMSHGKNKHIVHAVNNLEALV
jgi:hypothetical protein